MNANYETTRVIASYNNNNNNRRFAFISFAEATLMLNSTFLNPIHYKIPLRYNYSLEFRVQLGYIG